MPTISASQAPATGRKLGEQPRVWHWWPMRARGRARRIDGRLVVLAARAPAPHLFALARLHRRLEIVEQFLRTTVQEVPA